MAPLLRAIFGEKDESGSRIGSTQGPQVVTAPSGKFHTRPVRVADGSGLAKVTHSRERSLGLKPIHGVASYGLSVMNGASSFSRAIVAEALPDSFCPFAAPDGILGYTWIERYRDHISWSLLAKLTLILPDQDAVDFKLFRELHSALLERSIEQAITKGYKNMFVEISYCDDLPKTLASRDLYTARGFEVVGRLAKVLKRDDNDGLLDILMLQRRLDVDTEQTGAAQPPAYHDEEKLAPPDELLPDLGE